MTTAGAFIDTVTWRAFQIHVRSLAQELHEVLYGTAPVPYVAPSRMVADFCGQRPFYNHRPCLLYTHDPVQLLNLVIL